MQTHEAVHFVFAGSIQSDSFLEFAHHRASRLDLSMTTGPCAGNQISLSIRGQVALIDAFEMACSLGPTDCIVNDVQRFDRHYTQIGQ